LNLFKNFLVVYSKNNTENKDSVPSKAMLDFSTFSACLCSNNFLWIQNTIFGACCIFPHDHSTWRDSMDS